MQTHLSQGSPVDCEACQSLINPTTSHPPFGTSRDDHGRTYIFAHKSAAREHGMTIEGYLDIVIAERIRRGHGEAWIVGH